LDQNIDFYEKRQLFSPIVEAKNFWNHNIGPWFKSSSLVMWETLVTALSYGLQYHLK
jgi:hypothetical protein